MRHLGDVSLIHGGKIPPVDIISFGSPCQGLSLAGKHGGLRDPRSGLFKEAIRIIHQMRCATNNEYPKYAVWENVPGAFSNNDGEDFRSVLEAFCWLGAKQVSIPRPTKWERSGEIVGPSYSVAWRQLDSQFWGILQRRRRIFLVCDLRGWSAGSILFEQEVLFRDFEASNYCREANPYPALESSGSSGYSLEEIKCYGLGGIHSNSWKSNNPHSGVYEADCVRTLDRMCGGMCNQGGMLVVHPIRKVLPYTDVVGTLCARDVKGIGRQYLYENKLVVESVSSERYQGLDILYEEEHYESVEVEGNICRSRFVEGEPDYAVRRLTPLECCRLQGFPDDWCEGLGIKFYDTTKFEKEFAENIKLASNLDELSILTANYPDPEAFPHYIKQQKILTAWSKIWETHRQIVNPEQKPKTIKAIQRWLEAPRSDMAEFSMWGNSLAIPCALTVFGGIVEVEKEKL
jgi:DNA (cytosine-5)-methyltransferase 1